MSVTRRGFLQSATLTMLGGAVLPASLSASQASSQGQIFRPESLVGFNGISPSKRFYGWWENVSR